MRFEQAIILAKSIVRSLLLQIQRQRMIVGPVDLVTMR